MKSCNMNHAWIVNTWLICDTSFKYVPQARVNALYCFINSWFHLWYFFWNTRWTTVPTTHGRFISVALSFYETKRKRNVNFILSSTVHVLAWLITGCQSCMSCHCHCGLRFKCPLQMHWVTAVMQLMLASLKLQTDYAPIIPICTLCLLFQKNILLNGKPKVIFFAENPLILLRVIVLRWLWCFFR